MILFVLGFNLILLLIIIFLKHKSAERNTDAPNISNIPPISASKKDRTFTLAELKQAETSKYQWDETGCVFEINSDGSVTVIGHLDATELLADQKQKLYDRMVSEGLLEMLPRTWGFLERIAGSETEWNFIMSFDDKTIGLNIPRFYNENIIDSIKIATIYEIAIESRVIPLVDKLIQAGAGTIILMPSNEKEYILSLGAKEYLNRTFESCGVRITTPVVMGALWSAITGSSTSVSKVSFSYGKQNDYMCCDMLGSEGIYEVTELSSSSIIQPLESELAISRIVRGCLAQSLILEGELKNVLLLDMIPYPITFLLKEGKHIVKTFDIITSPVTIPLRQSTNNIPVTSDRTLSFVIGSTELIENIVAENEIQLATTRLLEACVNIDANMAMTVNLKSGDHISQINIGGLIG